LSFGKTALFFTFRPVFFNFFFNEKETIPPLYSTKKRHICHFIQGINGNYTTFFNEKVTI